MADFSPWTLFTDIGIIAALLLIGQIMRAKLKIVQKYFIPPSLMAGFIGLIFGPGGLKWLPLSDNMGVYASILIALIFACLPFSSSNSKSSKSDIGKMWAYSQGGMLMQWAFGGLLGLLVLRLFWPVSDAFGISMPCGYCGGHGTAAAVGQAFSQMGDDDMMTLAMTAATVGIVSSVFLGMTLIKWATKRGYTSFLATFENLPHELRTGLLPEDKRESVGQCTSSSISIDTIALNFCVLILVALCGYGISKGVAFFIPKLEMPVFSCAFIAGILLKFILRKAKAIDYICPKTVGHLSGAFTDFLVAFGISAIKLEIVLKYIVPLVILLASGIIATMFYVLFVGRRMMKNEFWFEKALFTWGWFSGTMATGIALLRIADPKMKSHCLEDYALAYLFIAPVEISLITFAPMAFVYGYGLYFSLIVLVLFLIILGFSIKKGWLKSK